MKAEKEMREKYESSLAVLNSSSGDKYQVGKYLNSNLRFTTVLAFI